MIRSYLFAKCHSRWETIGIAGATLMLVDGYFIWAFLTLGILAAVQTIYADKT